VQVRRTDCGEASVLNLGRRELISLLGGAAASSASWPLAARGQQTLPVIGLLGSETADWYADRLRAFREGLGETGYVEGRNVTIDATIACRRSRPSSFGNGSR
jgi:putative ABC transport system substrate-binding protein